MAEEPRGEAQPNVDRASGGGAPGARAAGIERAPSIDLNSDLGESFGTWRLGDDAAMLAIVSSANVACGFHAGDALTLRRTCALAAEYQVVVGAQVSYRDLAGFGRRFIDVDPDELTADVLYQLGALEAMCRVAGTRIRYLKPHGALYNAVVHHETQAAAVVAAVVAYDSRLPIVGLPGSVVHRLARDVGIPTVAEAFADRGYTSQGRLVPRNQPGALLHDPEQVAGRMLRLVRDGVIGTVDGGEIELRADSICTHGDTPGAVGLARAVRQALERTGVQIVPFAPRLD